MEFIDVFYKGVKGVGAIFVEYGIVGIVGIAFRICFTGKLRTERTVASVISVIPI